MQALGLDVLFKGSNLLRLLGGLWKALEISLIAVALSLILGVLFGILMTFRNPVIRALSRIYLEIVRIMPQMVLLFLVFFGTTRVFGWDLTPKQLQSLCLPFGARQKWAIWCAARLSACLSISMKARSRLV